MQQLDLLMIVALIGFLMSGYPVALVLGGTGLLFALFGFAAGTFDAALLAAIPLRIFGIMTNHVLIAVPLFVFMGAMLERSKVAEDLLDAMGALFARTPGGLGLSVMFVGMLMAASTGIVGATVVTMGLLSLPAMLKRGYSPSLASGTVAASGTLGQIIPPSIVLVILGDQLSNAWQKAQLASGKFSPDTVTVGDLFAGALFPGLLLVSLYMIYLFIAALRNPPQMGAELDSAHKDINISQIFCALVPPIVLIILVLGTILGGVATPTEAASVGAVGAILLGAARLSNRWRWISLVTGFALIVPFILAQVLDLRISRDQVTSAEYMGILVAGLLLAVVALGLAGSTFNLNKAKILRPVLQTTVQITTMIFAILIGASIFSLVFRGLGGDDSIRAILTSLPGGTFGALFGVMVLMFFLGFFLDFLEITFVVVPLVAPVLLQLPMADGSAMSPVWLGILMAVNLQTSFLTPPFGVALFYLRGVAPASVKTIDIYRGVIPFVALQLLVLVILWNIPELATWLPKIIYGVN
jgi:tripartite ATP-independent transporter DctM subunit